MPSLLAREITGRDGVALAVGALFLASPVVVIQSGVYLGYLFTVGLGNLALVCGLSGLRRVSRWRLASAGVLLGWILLTRPYDAVLWGLVLVVGAAACHRLDGLRRLWPVVLTGLPFVVATLAYNLRVTGHALTFPIVAADPLDTFGLGTRRLMPDFRPVHYGFGLATWSTAKNSFFFVVFLAGSAVTIVLALFGAWQRRRRSGDVDPPRPGRGLPARVLLVLGDERLQLHRPAGGLDLLRAVGGADPRPRRRSACSSSAGGRVGGSRSRWSSPRCSRCR